MLSSILALLGSGAKALATWLGIKKSQQDQAAGVAIEAGAQEKELASVEQAELEAANQSGSGGGIDSLRDGKF